MSPEYGVASIEYHCQKVKKIYFAHSYLSYSTCNSQTKAKLIDHYPTKYSVLNTLYSLLIMEDDLYSSYSFLLDKTSRRVKQYAKKRFQQLGFGITVDQWIILKNLYTYQGLSQSSLAKRTFKGMPTLTNMIDLLCKKGLVIRENDSEDRRKSRVSLTEAGRLKVEELQPQMAQIRKKAWENLSPDDFQQFKTVLETIYRNLE